VQSTSRSGLKNTVTSGAILMWVKICQARGKSGWLILLGIIPFVFLPYLAFSE